MSTAEPDVGRGGGAISFALQGECVERQSWLDLARRAEDAGFAALSVADHPGTTVSPFVALAAAAQVTERIRLATAVVNAGAWEPLALAAEVATLDLMSDGRAVLGIGAGHTPIEWTAVGRPYPTPVERLARLAAVVRAARRLLGGETVTVEDGDVRLVEACLSWRRPGSARVPIVIGGNARPLVRLAAATADALELTGLGPTLPDGHAHEPLWSTADLDERVDLLRSSTAGRPMELGVLVQHVEVTDDRTGALDQYRSKLATAVPGDSLPSIDDLAATPHLLVGTEDELVEQLRFQRERWGIARYTVREPAFHAISTVIARLA